MPRKCCVVKCSSGVVNSDGENRRQLFQFPSDRESKIKWLNALGHNLKKGKGDQKNLFICDQHFEENCFNREPMKVLKDGCQVFLHRKYLKLHTGSIPSIFKDNSQICRGVLSSIENFDSSENCYKTCRVSCVSNDYSVNNNIEMSTSKNSLSTDVYVSEGNCNSTHDEKSSLKIRCSSVPNDYSVNNNIEMSTSKNSLSTDVYVSEGNCNSTHDEKSSLKLRCSSVPNQDYSVNNIEMSTSKNSLSTDVHVSEGNCNSTHDEKSSLKPRGSSLKRFCKRELSPQSARTVNIANEIMSFNPSFSGESLSSFTDSENTKSFSEGTPDLKEYSISALVHDWNTRVIKDFPKHWGLVENDEGIIFVYNGDISCTITRSIFVNNDMTTQIKAHNYVAKFPVKQRICSFDDLRTTMIKLVCLKLCERSWKGLCKNGFYLSKPGSHSDKCKECQTAYKKEKRAERIKAKRLLIKAKNRKNRMKNLRQKISRATKKMDAMQQEIENLMDRCSKIDEKSLDSLISKVPIQMREVVKSIYTYGKVDDKRGIRHSKRWILECILLSIKSRKAYLHLRTHNILPLPTFTTLRSYLKNLKPEFGFDPQVFSLLKKKSAAMKPEERRGVLVLDEMQISKGISFDSANLSILGFTDLGEHTPENQRKERGDHALVFLFQPFRGQWVQNIAAFLSKGAANGQVLSHLVTECVILLENHGFCVDVVTSDGATWNRNMWKQFGVEGLEASCNHISSLKETGDSSEMRRLWFCSDFSHLVKNLRNFVMSREEIMTPDGVFKKKHFRAVIEGDGGKKNFGLKIAHKLTPEHLDPTFFEKMHVHKAFDVFSSQVATAMEIYKDWNDDLHDCEPTVQFITRFSKLITAMTSRSLANALFTDNSRYKEIIDFRNYVGLWKDLVTKNNYAFMSDNTYVGFHVTLTTAIEVMTFLLQKCDYKFLMTARLNQDALEGMFGMIRGCCGSYDKPDPLLFIQVYRLLSFYSLVKPPRGSNVEGLEIFESLLCEKDVKVNTNKEEWKAVLNEIIERGTNNSKEYNVRHSHDYNVVGVNDYALAYFSGFIARKIGKWTSCEDCLSSVRKSDGNLPRDDMIKNLNRGFLIYPSDILFNLLNSLEHAILQTVGEEQLNFYTFQHIMKNVLAESITFVGCEEHNKSLTKTVINYYAVARTNIICKKYNKIYNEARLKERKLRKLSKLVGKKDSLEGNTADSGVLKKKKTKENNVKRKAETQKDKQLKINDNKRKEETEMEKKLKEKDEKKAKRQKTGKKAGTKTDQKPLQKRGKKETINQKL